MTYISGRLVDLGIGKETVRGTAVTAAVWVPKIDFDFYDRANKVENKSSLGVIDGRSDLKLLTQWAEGRFGGNVRDKTFGYLLMAALGQTSTDALHAGETAVWDHTFTRLNSNQHQTLTLVRKDANASYSYALGALKTLELNLVVNEYFKYAADFMAKKSATVTPTVSYVAENEFLPKHVTVKLASAISGLAGASAVAVKSLKVTIEKNIEVYQPLGQLDPQDFVNKDFIVKGEVTLIYDTPTYHDYIWNETSMAMLLDVKNSDVTIGTATNPELQVTFAPMKFQNWNLKGPLDAVVEQTLGFEGLFNLTDAKTISAVLTNTSASY